MSTKNITTDRTDLEDIDNVEHNIDPGANTRNVIKDAHKDHTKGINAFLFEGGQNAIDAYWHRLSQNAFNDDRALELNFRVTPEQNIFEVWDNAGGMTNTKLDENYFRFGNPGNEKQDSDTGGSQGKGSWVMIGWGEKAYVETHDLNGDRWQCTAIPETHSNGNRSEIKQINNGRSELDQSGTYLRVHGVSDNTMEDLLDADLVIEKLTQKFPFALAHDNINITYTIVGDGEYTPIEYDFKKAFDQGGVVDGEDLDEFFLKGKKRQLKNLHLIDNRRVSEFDDPPWEGIAMLKGGEYVNDDDSEGHPYLNVWTYKPQNSPVIREGKLWGWVDASDLCPDLEEHGHTGFVGGDIYDKSGLRKRVIQAAKDYFDNQTVAEKGSSSRYVKDRINEWLDKMDNVDDSKKETKKGHPRDPVIHCSADGDGKTVDDKIPLALTIETPNRCRVEDVHIHIAVERIRDENGEKIPQAKRDTSGENFTETVESGLDNKELGAGVYEVQQEGKYKFKAELRQNPQVKKMDDLNLNDDNPAFRSKPILSESYTTFTIGDMDIDTPPQTPNDSTNASVIQEVHFTESEGDTWRAQMRSTEQKGVFEIYVNASHPEFTQIVKQYGIGKKGKVQSEVGLRWGFLRVFMQRAGNDIEDILAEHNVNNSEVIAAINGEIKRRLEEYDEFRYNSVQDSPLYQD